MTEKTSKDQLQSILKNYLESGPVARKDGKTSEIELRFGGNKDYKPFSKIDYDNVAQSLYNHGFVPENPNGFHSLRIFHWFTDNNGITKRSNIRTELVGLDLIQEYCKTNSLDKILSMPSTTFDKLKFTQKTTPQENEQYIKPADFKEFNTRIAYQLEQSYSAKSGVIRGMIDKWGDYKKTFRLLNRVRFVHKELPLFADLSIVKSSKTTNRGKTMMSTFNIQESNIFNNLENYEIEMEVNNEKVGVGTDYDTVEKIINMLRKIMRVVLSGLQQTNYPISYVEQDHVLQSYFTLLHGKDKEYKRIHSKDFIGPSSYTLQLKHIVEDYENMNLPNIRQNYTVTDKADGNRCLLYINAEGKIYLINTNMSVIFTGSKTENKDCFNSLLDGEHILRDKYNNFINLYAVFDIYFINTQDVRTYPFYISIGDDELYKGKKVKYRASLMSQFITLLKHKNILNSKDSCEFNIEAKSFYAVSDETSIFQGCSKILSDIHDNIYKYNTDGLIFTPSDKAVGSDVVGIAGPLYKTTWNYSFKWKPAEFNTIDLLVRVKKDHTGKDEVHNIFQDGMDLVGGDSISQYKTLILMCGYNEAQDGYLNPFEDMLKGRTHTSRLDEESNLNKYRPEPFIPTDPYDPKACFANILLQKNGKELYMLTEENEYFEDHMIVEFKYDVNERSGWRWKPLRVRYDKTNDLKNGNRNYGNAYRVANNNWLTIHNPITSEMISSGVDVPDYFDNYNEETQDEIYYQRNGSTYKSKSMRDFHNLYVKKRLIQAVSETKHSLIDYAVGKAGDLPKWIDSKLGFVFGIDLSRDNINNRKDGACARYLNQMSNYKKIPTCVFVNGNSGENIRKGAAFNEEFATTKEKEIVQALFGNGPKDATLLGEVVKNNYGVGSGGFNISSVQFALHYFFESEQKLNEFVKNVAECTKLNGYFIGTCYDGQTVFDILKDTEYDDSIVYMENNHKMYEITKKYKQTGFPDDETSLNYPIHVFQDSIGKVSKEYLVNFDYFIRVMENYGFVLISDEDAKTMGLPHGTGLFKDLFTQMEHESKRKYKQDFKNALYMSPQEKQVSFMNRYFVFRKLREVDADKLLKMSKTKSVDDMEIPVEKTDAKKTAKRVKIVKKK
tara:strand:- start:3138 stop:6500 length:3363 start_codon:yes stop_codon:yes gene_type:complete